MLTSLPWLELATAHGISVRAPSGDPQEDVVLGGKGMPATPFQVKAWTRALSPSTLRALGKGSRSGARILVLTDHPMSEEAKLTAEKLGISTVVTLPGRPIDATLIHSAGMTRISGGSPAPSASTRARGRVPWGTFAAAFLLLEGPQPSHDLIAASLGLSRVRVTQVLKELDAFVGKRQSGWQVKDAYAMSDWLIIRYPRSNKPVTTWLTLDTPVTTVQRASDFLSSITVKHAVSGDVAADRIAPWERPRAGLIWAEKLTDMRMIGATPAPPDGANLIVAVPEDPFVLRACSTTSGMPMLASWRIWLDLVRLGRTDAARRLRDTLVEPSTS